MYILCAGVVPACRAAAATCAGLPLPL